MILEGLVTTVSAAGVVNIAPMGPHIAAASFDRFELRPFRTAQTYLNLTARPEGVFHVTDDVLLLARAAVGDFDALPELLPTQVIAGWRLADACRTYEFRIVDRVETGDRARLTAEVVHAERIRDFLGFNRAKHAVVEAAILATRLHLLPADEVSADFRKLGVIVDKTGGPQEREAFAFLQNHLSGYRRP
jgi:hypothetical protein